MNTEIISAILNILNNKESVDFNQLAATIISGLNSNKTSEQSNKKFEELHNLTSIVKAAEMNFVIGDYISEDCKQKVEHIVKAFEYMSDRLTDEQVDYMITDVKEIVDQIEKKLTENLTEVLTKAGIRIQYVKTSDVT